MTAARRYRQVTWAIVGLWFVVCLTTLDYNGPFFDEGIYLTAGQRTLQGHGYADGYLGWFAGSLLWPALAGVGVRAAGLTGARAIALLLAAVALIGLGQATSNLFGARAGLWATIAFAVCGPFLALARMGVYDSTALAGLAVSFWAVTELWVRDHRGWVAVAAAGFAVAMVAKYPVGLMLLPLLAVLVVLRRHKALVDITMFGFVSLAIALALFLPVREQLAWFIRYRLTNSPASGVSAQMIAVDLFRLSAVPVLLATAGALLGRDRRALVVVLLLAVALWPTYHLILRDPVSSNKHIVYGFLFAYPLIGLAAHRLWVERERLVLLSRSAVVSAVVLLAALGLRQAIRLGHAWPDARPAASYLIERVRPGQQLLINESWPYTMYLYAAGRIRSPWDVFDVYRITHGESEIPLCDYDWFVDSQGAYRWPNHIAAAIRQCGTFEPTFATTSEVESMGTNLDYVRYPVSTTVWRNTARVSE